MNGSEYKQLFDMAQEGRDAALSCVRVLSEHTTRLDSLEKKVNKNVSAVEVGRFGLRALGWGGSILIGLGGLLYGIWQH